MQISHVVLNYFFISYIIVVDILSIYFILQIGVGKKFYFFRSFKRFGLCQEKEVRESWNIQTFLFFLERPAVKFHLIFFIFPIKLSSCLVLRKSLCLMTESVLLEWNLNFYLTFSPCHFTLKKFECLNLCFHHYIVNRKISFQADGIILDQSYFRHPNQK